MPPSFICLRTVGCDLDFPVIKHWVVPHALPWETAVPTRAGCRPRYRPWYPDVLITCSSALWDSSSWHPEPLITVWSVDCWATAESCLWLACALSCLLSWEGTVPAQHCRLEPKSKTLERRCSTACIRKGQQPMSERP